MKNNFAKKIISNIFSRSFLLSLLIAFSIALILILAIWGFELRSVSKWIFQASLIAIPFCVLLFFFFFRHQNLSLSFNLPLYIIGALNAGMISSQVVPAQLTPMRTFLVHSITVFLLFVIFNLIVRPLLENSRISWESLTLWIVVGAGLIGLVLLIRNSLFARLYSDDFCYAVNFDQLGFPGAALFFYKDWSGRFFSNFLVMGLTDQPLTIIYLVVLTMASIFFAILTNQKSRSLGGKLLYASAAATLFMLAISFAAPDFYKSFFWICSALILFPAFILIPINLSAVSRMMQEEIKHPRITIIINAVISFCIATTHEVTALAWLVLNGAGMLWSLMGKSRNKYLKILFSAAIVATLIGLVVLLSSPGIENRAHIQQYPGSTPILQTIPILFKNFFEFIQNISTPYYTFEANGRAGWFFIIGLMGLGLLSQFGFPRKWAYVLIIGGITASVIFAASFPAAYVYRGNIPLRTQMIPVFFLALGAFTGGFMLPKPEDKTITNAILLFTITSVLLGLRLVIPQMQTIKQPLQQYASDWDLRDQKYIQSTDVPPRIEIPWDEYEQNINCVELYYAHLNETSKTED